MSNIALTNSAFSIEDQLTTLCLSVIASNHE
jgi:hypothetical protein